MTQDGTLEPECAMISVGAQKNEAVRLAKVVSPRCAAGQIKTAMDSKVGRCGEPRSTVGETGEGPQ